MRDNVCLVCILVKKYAFTEFIKKLYNEKVYISIEEICVLALLDGHVIIFFQHTRSLSHPGKDKKELIFIQKSCILTA